MKRIMVAWIVEDSYAEEFKNEVWRAFTQPPESICTEPVPVITKKDTKKQEVEEYRV